MLWPIRHLPIRKFARLAFITLSASKRPEATQKRGIFLPFAICYLPFAICYSAAYFPFSIHFFQSGFKIIQGLRAAEAQQFVLQLGGVLDSFYQRRCLRQAFLRDQILEQSQAFRVKEFRIAGIIARHQQFGQRE